MAKKANGRTLRLRVSDDLLSWLRSTAARKGITVDDVVRENLEALVSKSIEEIKEFSRASRIRSRNSAPRRASSSR